MLILTQNKNIVESIHYIFMVLIYLLHWDLNPRSFGYEPTALASELCSITKLQVMGLELILLGSYPSSLSINLYLYIILLSSVLIFVELKYKVIDEI